MDSKGSQRLYWLTGLFVVLLLFVIFFDNDRVEEQSKHSKYLEPVFTQKQIDGFDKIVLLKDDVQTVLSKVDSTWKVSDGGDVMYDVDGLQWGQFFEILQKFPRGQLVSKNADSWATFMVDEENARMFRVSSGGSDPASYLIGKSGASRNDVYYRVEGEDEVYLAETRLRDFMVDAFSTWRDKKLIHPDFDRVRVVALKKGDDKWKLVLEGDVWKVTHGESSVDVASSEVETYLKDKIFTLRATGFDEGVSEKDARIGSEFFKMYTEDADGKTFDVMVYKDEKDSKVVAVRSDYEFVYSVSESMFANILPDFASQEPTTTAE